MAVVTRDMVRQALVNKIISLKNTFTAFPLEVEYDNKVTIDLTKQQKPFLQFSIVYQDGEQVGLGIETPSRVMGTIVMAVRGREGSGVVDMDKVVDHFLRAIGKTDTIGPVRTYAARFSSSPSMNGWVSQAALVPFWYDTD